MVLHKRKAWLIYLSSWFTVLWSASVFAAPFHGLPIKSHRVTAPDGVELVLFEIMANDGPEAQVVEFKPGFAQTAEAVDDRVVDLVRRGKKVFVGQVRLAGRGEHQSEGGEGNRLEDVLKLDAPTLTAEVIRQAKGRQVEVIGFSMGAIQLMAMESDPEIKARLFPRIGAKVYIGGPHNFKDLSWPMKALARTTLPLIKKARSALDADTLSWHTSLFDFTLKLKRSGKSALVVMGHSLEASFMTLGNVFVQGAIGDLPDMSSRARRRLWFKDLSPLPLDLMVSFIEAAASEDGEIRDRQGRKLIDPEMFEGPMLVVRASNDTLSPKKQNQELFDRAGGAKEIVKKMITVYGVKHLTVTHGDNPSLSFMDLLIDFIEDPGAVARSMADDTAFKRVGFCERLLTKAISWFR